ncbi:MAG TPA: hypothetical protein VGQ12_12615 [Candidatus Angelobacter sp.]|jgi:hypothetical protein|nr:hypothetical protein [Candidatus Angelobacter sp.]
MMNRRSLYALCALFALAQGCNDAARTGATPDIKMLSVANASGLTLRVADEHAAPALWLSIPGQPSGHDAVFILLPEHVTVRKHNTNEVEHLYLWRSGQAGSRSNWVRIGNSLQYTTDFQSGIHLLARATLEPDGVLYHYEFYNGSDIDLDSVQTITDPRMLSPMLHDVRLERTYVHSPQGFVLLASDTPERLTMPLSDWLPNRYRISYTWPVNKTRKERQEDGVTFYNASHRTDEPVIATVSTDHHWIMATFSRQPGNLWTNPELTCQHADPDISVPRHKTGVIEEKMLLFPGTLDDVLGKVHQQQSSLN